MGGGGRVCGSHAPPPGQVLVFVLKVFTWRASSPQGAAALPVNTKGITRAGLQNGVVHQGASKR